jgi:carnitine O-acetyltransferase
VGYIIKDDALSICAASKHLQTQRFLDTLHAYLLDMKRILTEHHNSANVRRVETYIDHQGRECDIRTGLPIGSNQDMSNGYDLGEEEGTGVSGYSFYGEQEQKKKVKDISDTRRIAGVGRMLMHNDYA